MYGRKRTVYRIFLENLKKRPTLGDTGINGRIILKWIQVGNSLEEGAVD
jgi:hypothetical protein